MSLLHWLTVSWAAVLVTLCMQVWCSCNSADWGDASVASVQRWTVAERSFPLLRGSGYASLQVAGRWLAVVRQWAGTVSAPNYTTCCILKLSLGRCSIVRFYLVCCRWHVCLTEFSIAADETVQAECGHSRFPAERSFTDEHYIAAPSTAHTSTCRQCVTLYANQLHSFRWRL